MMDAQSSVIVSPFALSIISKQLKATKQIAFLSLFLPMRRALDKGALHHHDTVHEILIMESSTENIALELILLINP